MKHLFLALIACLFGAVLPALPALAQNPSAVQAQINAVPWGSTTGQVSGYETQYILTSMVSLFPYYAPLYSPSFTGAPLAPTAMLGTNTNQIATTAFVLANGGIGDLTGLVVGNGSSAPTAIAPGAGVAAALPINVGAAGSLVVNGGALGTPASGNGENLTGITAPQIGFIPGYANAVASETLQSILQNAPLDLVNDFGADPTGVANSTTKFGYFFAAMCANKKQGHIPSGTYTLTAGVIWNFVSCPYGVKLLGDSHGEVILNFVGSASVGWQWEITGGSGPSSVIPHVYDEMGNLTITCDLSTVCWALGQNNGADVFESSTFHDMQINNTNSSASIVAMQINGSNNNQFNNIQAQATYASTSSVGNGISMQITMAAFNQFNADSISNSNIAYEFTNLSNSAIGFSYGNTFLSNDVENVCKAIVFDATNSAPKQETFIGGRMYTIAPNGSTCPLISNSMPAQINPGGNLIFQNVNADSNYLYGNATVSQPFPLLDPAHPYGVQILGYYGNPGASTVTPPGSATGCSTNLITNTTGQRQRETYAGTTATGLCLGGQTYSITTLQSSYQITVEPGETFGAIYGSGSPIFIQQTLPN